MYPPEDGQDVIGNGDDQRGRITRWLGRADRKMTLLAAAALGVGLIAGYLGGHQQNRAAQPPRPRTTTPAQRSTPPLASQQSLGPALAATGNRCALQRGTALELGVEVANQSGHAIAVRQFRAVLPLGGLRPAAASVGTCGALPSGVPPAQTLPAGATEWLTISFDVLVRCPQPLPVQFLVSYTDSGKPMTAQLDEFPDLGQVAYSGCPAAQ
jgi:hypothetical protein